MGVKLGEEVGYTIRFEDLTNAVGPLVYLIRLQLLLPRFFTFFPSNFFFTQEVAFRLMRDV